MQKFFPLITSIVFLILLSASAINAHEERSHESKESVITELEEAIEKEDADLNLSCEQLYRRDGKCPTERCLFQCLGGIKTKGCKETCNPIPCVEIDAEFCPEFRCQVLKGCSGEDECYYRVDDDPPKCGGIAFAGQSVECCEGLQPKCGVEFFDTSCDMVAKYSVYSVPICLPCGNGICNQFENRCNCPEDCLNR